MLRSVSGAFSYQSCLCLPPALPGCKQLSCTNLQSVDSRPSTQSGCVVTRAQTSCVSLCPMPCVKRRGKIQARRRESPARTQSIAHVPKSTFPPKRGVGNRGPHEIVAKDSQGEGGGGANTEGHEIPEAAGSLPFAAKSYYLHNTPTLMYYKHRREKNT